MRVSVANYENLISNALKRAIKLNEGRAIPRISDLHALVASTAGKIEIESVGEIREDKLIDKSGAWFSYGNERIGQGRENAKQWLRDNTDRADEIRRKVLEKRGMVAPVGVNGQAESELPEAPAPRRGRAAAAAE